MVLNLVPSADVSRDDLVLVHSLDLLIPVLLNVAFFSVAKLLAGLACS